MEYQSKVDLFLKNEGDAEIAFDQFSKQRTKRRNKKKSKSRKANKKVTNNIYSDESESEMRSMMMSVGSGRNFQASPRSVLKTSQNNWDSANKGSNRSISKKSVRIKDSAELSRADKPSSFKEKKLKFNLSKDTSESSKKTKLEIQTGEIDMIRNEMISDMGKNLVDSLATVDLDDKKAKVIKKNIGRRKTQKLPKLGNNKVYKNRRSVRV